MTERPLPLRTPAHGMAALTVASVHDRSERLAPVTGEAPVGVSTSGTALSASFRPSLFDIAAKAPMLRHKTAAPAA